MPKVFDEVPCRFEEVPIQQPATDGIMDTDADDTPPMEIILPARKSSQNIEPDQPDNEPETTNVQTSGLQVKFSYWSDLVSLARKDWWYTLVRQTMPSKVPLNEEL